jgi:hypothetical protein
MIMARVSSLVIFFSCIYELVLVYYGCEAVSDDMNCTLLGFIFYVNPFEFI